ncbi:MAG: ABC transporter ATP-binding protein [Bacteroidetes bacterium]|nr:ABC transporter ATP-binding protein [Bacteroidota bacterium]
MLTATDLSIGYHKDKALLSGITFTAGAGQLLLLLGINGIGKSTLLRTLCGLLPPVGGQVQIDGRDTSALVPQDRAKLISGVFTGRDFDPYITIRELVTLGRYPYTDWAARLSPTDMTAIDRAIGIAGIGHLAGKRINQVSDGERQKALIAKSIAQDTPVIIMDEPTAFLDYKNKAELLRTMRMLATDHGKTVLLSTHDIAAALPYSDRVLLIAESGTFHEAAGAALEEASLKIYMETH